MKIGRRASRYGWMQDARARLRVPLPATLAVALVGVGAFGPSSLGPMPKADVAQPVAAAAMPTEEELAVRATALAGYVDESESDLQAPECLEEPAYKVDDATAALVTSGVIPSGGTLAGSLRASGIRAGMIHEIARELQSVLDFRHARPGDRYSLTRGPNGTLKEFGYATASGTHYRITRDGERFVAETREPTVVRRTARVAGVIETTLYDAVQMLGESRQLATDFAEIFQWDVDFAHAVQRGDEFQVLYERLYRVRSDGRETFVGPGRILAARYKGRAGDVTAFYFETEQGSGTYFRPDGSPMERAFLAAPLKYERVSSSYSLNRPHPILDISRPHLGIDYAAPAGTPIWSIADGKVVFKGRMGGFGNLLKVEHANGYVTFYSHLSRYAKGLEVGQRVRQKQVIGFVGSTGLATGPHVCFRVQKDGRFMNPAKLRAGAMSPVAIGSRGDFRAAKQTLLADLAGRSLVSVDEAL